MEIYAKEFIVKLTAQISEARENQETVDTDEIYNQLSIDFMHKFGMERDRARMERDQLAHEKERFLDILAESGGIHVIKWSRDCDCAESTSRHFFESRAEFEQWENSVYDWAEGPVSVKIVSRDEYEDFEPYFRDRVMEAYENGRGISVIL